MDLHTVLCPIDFSPTSIWATRLAEALAKMTGGRLVLTHVVEPAIPYATGFNYLSAAEQTEQARRELMQVRPLDPQVPCEHILLHGDVARQLLRYTQDHAVDAIVIGTHGRTGLSRMFVGSVAEFLLRHASCPVVAVKVPLSLAAVESDERAGQS